jgi:tripartite ATP-independent transporter DctM subunit
MDLAVFLGVFITLLVIGAPIYLSLIVPSIVYIIMNPALPMITMVQKMVVSLNSFPLMAVPFFVLAGALMNVGSVTDRIFGFAKSVVGHRRGGLGHVNILASVIFSGMSGSAVADVGGLGQIELKAMRAAGYDDGFSIGITAASSTIGPIIPPSIPFVVFASYASVSTGAMFMGGFLPGLMVAVILGITVFFIAKKRNYPREPKAGLRGIWKSLKHSWLALLMPLIIIGGIWTGLFTATEAALVSIVYALIISMFVYKDIKIKQLPKQLLESAENIIPVMMVIVGATLFCWILNYEKLDQVILNVLVSFTSSKYVVLLLICLFVMILGMFFDGIVAILLLVPILLPICSTYGIHPIHLGVVITVGNMIGLLTPPVGMSLYVLSSVTKKPLSAIIRYCVPWLVPLIISWLIMALWEPLVMFIPNLMGLGGGL